jgi:trypsin
MAGPYVSLLLLLLACQAGLARAHRCDRFREFDALNLNLDDLETKARIVGGSVADEREQPWTISIRRQSSCRHFCGGSLISPRWAITAAHCIWKRLPWELFVVAGGQTARRTPGDQSIAVRRILPHPDYNYCRRNFIADIGLLQLDEDCRVVSHFVRLPRAVGGLAAPLDEGSVEVIGLGRRVAKGPTAYKRLKAVLTVLPAAECQRIYRKQKDNMFCAGRPGQDTCQGDSGAGAIAEETILGVVSHGVGCGSYPGVYTDVRYYAGWVRKTVAEEDASTRGGKGMDRAAKELELKALIKRLFKCHGVRTGELKRSLKVRRKFLGNDISKKLAVWHLHFLEFFQISS